MNELSRRLLLSVVVCLLATSDVSTTERTNHPEFTNELAIHEIVFDGSISGKVTQADGVTPISGATVKALQGTSTIATTTTNSTGDYVLGQLPAGSYRVEASATGFGTKSQSLITVVDNQATTVNLKLDQIVAAPTSYIYDALGRLVATVGPTDTTIYSYDSVGNLLSISRQPSSQLSIINVVPNKGSVGQMVTINGTGFSATPSVQFNGVAATVLSATDTRIITTVPAVGVTGQIQIAVTTSQGTVTAPFTVLAAELAPGIQVAPGSVSILPGQTVQFVATVSGITGDQSVQWSVNGIQGGDSYVGTISSTGLYTSPNSPSFIFTIRATSVADPAVFGQAQLAILNPALAEVPISSAVSVRYQTAIAETAFASQAVSVQRLSATDSGASASQAVSVRRLSATDSGASASQAVSIRRLSPADTGAPSSPAISVRRNDAVTSSAPQSVILSLTTGPLVQSVSPTSGAQSTNFTITISGANLDGATGLSFLTTAGLLDSTITASNITVDTNGTSLTATVTVSGSAALGQRVVVVVTPAGHSLTVGVGTNLLEIVP